MVQDWFSSKIERKGTFGKERGGAKVHLEIPVEKDKEVTSWSIKASLQLLL